MTTTIDTTHRIEGRATINSAHTAAVKTSEDHIRDALGLGLSPAEVAHGLGSDLMAHQSDVRSEEHTSELQSLMRISYAVFCLKKKQSLTQKQNNHKSTITTQTYNTHTKAAPEHITDQS